LIVKRTIHYAQFEAQRTRQIPVSTRGAVRFFKTANDYCPAVRAQRNPKKSVLAVGVLWKRIKERRGTAMGPASTPQQFPRVTWSYPLSGPGGLA